MRYLNFYYLLLVSFFIISCSNNDNNEEIDNLTITESKLTFNSLGGVGSIKVKSSSDIKAQSDNAWCTVTVIDNESISVNVSKNVSKEGRVAKVTIMDGIGHVCQIGVTQSGCLLNIENERTIYFNNMASTKIISIYSDEAIHVSCEDNWIKAEISNNSLNIYVEKNISNRMRKTYIYVESNLERDTLSVFQGNLDNLLGKYLLYSRRALNPNYGAERKYSVELMKNGEKYFLGNFRIPGDEDKENELFRQVYIPIKSLGEKLTFAILNSEYSGISFDNRYSLFLCQAIKQVGSSTYMGMTKGPSVSLNFDIVDGKIVGKIEDNGSWPDGVMTNTIYLIGCTPNNITNFADVTSIDGFYEGLYDITLEKIEE